jgi:hypothetical protein
VACSSQVPESAVQLAFGCIRRCSRDLCPFVTAGCRPSPGAPRGAASAVVWKVSCRSRARALPREPPLPSGFARWLVCRGEVLLLPAHRSHQGRSAAVPLCIAAARPVLRASRATPRPSIDMLSGVHSPGNIAASGSVHGVSRRESRSVLVVSHHLDGFRRPGPAGARLRGWLRCFQESRACCIPLPILGFAAFLAVHLAVIAHRLGPRLPAARFVPLEVVPLPTADAHRCASFAPSPFSRPRGLAPW